MEFFLFLGLAFVGAVFYLWRSRRRTSDDVESMTKGMPDDLRDKNTGMVSLPNRGRPWGRGN
jgi:cbb3-type cytochrome oxidase subunit 3